MNLDILPSFIVKNEVTPRLYKDNIAFLRFEETKHFTVDQLSQLQRAYYTETSVKQSDIIEHYGLTIHQNKLSYVVPPKLEPTVFCIHCDTPMYYNFPKRSMIMTSELICLSCGHKENIMGDCTCKNCISSREEIFRRVLKQHHDSSTIDCYDHMDPIDQIKFGALLYGFTGGNLVTIDPLGNSAASYTPTTDLTDTYLSDLYARNALLFHKRTPMDSLIIKDGKIESYYYFRCKWMLNVVKSCQLYEDENGNIATRFAEVPEAAYESLFISLQSGQFVFTGDYDCIEESILHLWQEINFHTALAYLYLKMDEYNLPKKFVGDVIKETVKELSLLYSVSEMCQIIYTSVKSIAAYMQKERVYQKEAVNALANKLKFVHGKMKTGEWQLRGYSRDFDLKRSIIEEYLFDHVTKIGERGFTEVPNLDSVKAALPEGLNWELPPEAIQKTVDYKDYLAAKGVDPLCEKIYEALINDGHLGAHRLPEAHETILTVLETAVRVCRSSIQK